MAYYNEIFIEENGTLVHIGSCNGSDTPCYFTDVKNINDWARQLNELKRKNGYFPHNNLKHPFPWSTYKTSDHLIVFKPNKRKWFQFWRPTHQVWISVNKYEIKDDYKCWFIESSKWGGDSDYNQRDLIILQLPSIKKVKTNE